MPRLDTTIKTSKDVKEALRKRYPELKNNREFTFHKLILRDLLNATTIASKAIVKSNKFHDTFNSR